MTKTANYKNFRSSQGFSLMELIIVIVLTGIMAISLTSLSRYSISGYIDGKDRNRLSQSGKWVSERLSRELRNALPQSVRVDGTNNCVEFMVIRNASSSLDMPPSNPVTTFNAVAFDLGGVAANFIAVMPLETSGIYAGVGAGTLAGVNSVVASGLPGQVTVTLNAPSDFDRRSALGRFYLLDNPVSFCLDEASGQLGRYSNYAITQAQAVPPVGGDVQLIAENYSANGPVFNYQAGALSRANLLQMNFRLQNRARNLAANSESFNIFHEVHIRNVP